MPEIEPLLSIVSGTMDRPDSYKLFIDSVVEHTHVPHEIIIADASQGENYVHEPPARPEMTRFVHIVEKPRIGTLKGYNVAFRQSRARYTVWFNDDCEMLPGWDLRAVNFMEAHPEIGIGIVYFKDTHRGTLKPYYEYQTYFKVPVPNFGVVRREVGEKIGWFDESLGNMYGCDTDLGMQTLVSGYGVAPIPGCKIIHHRVWDQQREENYMRRNLDTVKFVLKWPKTREPEIIAAYQPWASLKRSDKVREDEE